MLFAALTTVTSLLQIRSLEQLYFTLGGWALFTIAMVV